MARPPLPPLTVGEATIAIRRMRAPWIESRHKLVLWALASRLPDVYPTQDQIAEDAHFARSNVRVALDELRAHGLIAFDGGKGKRRSYRLNMRAIRKLDPEPCADGLPQANRHDGPNRDGLPQANRDGLPQAKVGLPQANAKSQILIQSEADSDAPACATGVRPEPRGRPPLPHLSPTAYPRPHLQPVAPRRVPLTRQPP